jgi:hypothetical protein
MESNDPDLGSHLLYGIYILRLKICRIVNQDIPCTCRNFQLDRQFEIWQVEVEAGTELIIKITSLKSDINRFVFIIFLFTCQVVAEIKPSDNVWSDIIKPGSLEFEKQRELKKG